MVVSPPAWLGPPHNVLPGIAPVQLIIARTDETVVAVAGIQAYPAGFSFTLSLHLRNLSAREERRNRTHLTALTWTTRWPMTTYASVCSSPTAARQRPLMTPPTIQRAKRQTGRS
jgi:hypothetical protein